MSVLVYLLLLPLVSCQVDKVENTEARLTKRGLDHTSNIALLNSLSFDTNKQVVNLHPLSTSAPSIVNPTEGTLPVTINTQHLALGNPNTLQNGLQFMYAPAYTQAIPAQSFENNIIYITGDRNNPSQGLPISNVLDSAVPFVGATTNLQTVVPFQDNRNVLQSYVPQNVQQNVVEVPQPYPLQFIREVKVPQPYPVHITRTVQVPVQVRVPVEVPRPYAVKVPHPVPVPVHIRVPVTVEKPYPVHITKTVAVPVEKPVYIKVPHPVQVPVPQPYPVAVPQPVQVQVPFVVRLPEGAPVPAPVLTNFEGGAAPLVPNFGGAQLAGGLPALPNLNPVVQAQPVAPFVSTTECSSCSDKNEVLVTSPKPNLTPVTGSGLLPPHPPSNLKRKTEEGLLKSYVSSKEGGVYRRSTEYQTNEYK